MNAAPAFLLGFAALMGFLVLVFGGSGPTFTLEKAHWTCTASHHETSRIATRAPTTNAVCDRYERIKP